MKHKKQLLKYITEKFKFKKESDVLDVFPTDTVVCIPCMWNTSTEVNT